MKKILALLLALVMLVSLVACGAKEDAPAADAPVADAPVADAPVADEPAADNSQDIEVAEDADFDPAKYDGKIGFFYAAPHPFGEACKEGADAWAAEKGVNAIIKIGPDWTLDSQVVNLEAMMAQGCEAIGTFPMDNAVYDGMYDEQQGKVIFNNLGWNSTAETKAQHLVSTNIYASAYKSMEYIGELLDYKGGIMIAYESVTDSATMERKAAVNDFLAEHPDMWLECEAFDYMEVAAAAVKIENTMNAHEGKINGIVALGFTSTQALVGVLGDYYERGGEKIPCVGIDTDDLIFQGIRDGIITATVAQNSWGIGYIGMEVMRLQLDGYTPKEGKYHIDTGIVLVTADNIETYEQDLEAVTQEIVATLTTEYMEKK